MDEENLKNNEHRPIVRIGDTITGQLAGGLQPFMKY